MGRVDLNEAPKDTSDSTSALETFVNVPSCFHLTLESRSDVTLANPSDAGLKLC